MKEKKKLWNISLNSENSFLNNLIEEVGKRLTSLQTKQTCEWKSLIIKAKLSSCVHSWSPSENLTLPSLTYPSYQSSPSLHILLYTYISSYSPKFNHFFVSQVWFFIAKFLSLWLIFQLGCFKFSYLFLMCLLL
jgi:hypothetical protein